MELAPHPQSQWQSYKLVNRSQERQAVVVASALNSNSKYCYSYSYFSSTKSERVRFRFRFVKADSVVIMAQPRTSNQLRHVDSMATLPSGAGKIPHLNAVILGESLASEENDFIYPSDDFSRQARVPSPQKVTVFSLI